MVDSFIFNETLASKLDVLHQLIARGFGYTS